MTGLRHWLNISGNRLLGFWYAMLLFFVLVVVVGSVRTVLEITEVVSCPAPFIQIQQWGDDACVIGFVYHGK